MTTVPEPLYVFDFLYEHTLSKSRLLAQVGTYDTPAPSSRSSPARRKSTPTRPSSCCARYWPPATPQEPGPAPRAPSTSPRTTPLRTTRPSRTTAPHGKRLRDLPGKVVRIATLREFHITDEDALIREAMTYGWEPIPASERGDDEDPRDLIGAVMVLSGDEGSSITGADTLEDQTEAGLLRADEGDELADWSKHPIRTRFTYGHRLRAQPAPDPERIHQEQPLDLAHLFPVKECGCDEEDCENCAWQLTPRTADLLLTALSVLADQAFDDAEELGDHPVSDHQPGNWEVFTRLTSLTFKAKRRWRRRMARAFDDLAHDLEQGHWPQPTCTAEEMALHLAIEDAPMYLEDIDDDHRHQQLPSHADDYDWDTCSDLFFQDHDVLMLFDRRLDGIERPDGEVNQYLGVGDLRAPAWFEPFGYPSARDPERGFRR